jgi:hypothetical protein
MLRSLHQQRPQIGIAFFADVHLRLVKLGVANSRMKDFYDLWVLAQRFEFESSTLAAAIQATFKTRRTTVPKSSPPASRTDFYELPAKQTQWKAFLLKSGLKADSSLREIIEVIRELILPVVDGVLETDEENEVWQQGGPWRGAGDSNSGLSREASNWCAGPARS